MSSGTVGKGRVIYVGTYLTEALVPLLFDEVFDKAGVTPLLENLPEGVEVCTSM